MQEYDGRHGLITFLNQTGSTLRILRLRETAFSFSGIESVTVSFRLLEEFYLSNCKNMTDTGLVMFLNKTGGNLKILKLYITDVSLLGTESMTSNVSLLKELDLSECWFMT